MNALNYGRIGRNIRNRRLALGMTQEYIAGELEVNPSHISNIECGRTKPSLTILVQIADILGCSIDLFLEEEYQLTTENTAPEAGEAALCAAFHRMDPKTKEKLIQIARILEGKQ